MIDRSFRNASDFQMKKFRHGYCYISVDRQNHDVAPTERNAVQPALNAFPEQPADTAEATSRAGLGAGLRAVQPDVQPAQRVL